MMEGELDTIFRSFTVTHDDYCDRKLNVMVNEYIQSKRKEGYIFMDKNVLIGGQSDNGLIKPNLTVIVWMRNDG